MTTFLSECVSQRVFAGQNASRSGGYVTLRGQFFRWHSRTLRRGYRAWVCLRTTRISVKRSGMGMDAKNYLFIPLLGPSTDRDVSGIPFVAVVHPMFWIGCLL